MPVKITWTEDAKQQQRGYVRGQRKAKTSKKSVGKIASYQHQPVAIREKKD